MLDSTPFSQAAVSVKISNLPICFCSFGLSCPALQKGARCSSVVRAFAHGAMGPRIDPSWGGPIELFLVQASAPRQV